ncbi:hypothetical protein AoKodu_02530 [Actinomyces oris K20]|uniref:hypothetical protein n=1 Tax=Actinomyces oris TaxID=544580 RepID=UPI0002003A53|nr:hypothetical protein [Actinomyces oris]BDF97952.1 hypothetical protein AoKodu_02530 [Actinomyces oris K20]
MAIYIRSRPTTGIKALGYLGTLAAIGIALLYPLILVLAAFALGALDEAVAYPEDNESVANAATVVGVIPAIYSFVLTAIIFGATSAFKGEDRWLTKDATVTHRDIASARFLHVSQDPNSRAVGMLWAMLAGMLLVASPFLAIAIPHALIYSESTQELVEEATWGVSLLIIALFVALVYAAVRRRASAVRMTPHGMAVANLAAFTLPPPSSRGNLSIQEAPARRGRVKVQAVYAPPAGGAEPGRPVIIPRLGLTVRPSRLDDARSRVEARLDEVWRAAQLIRASVEQEETADAPTSEAGTNPTHQLSPAPPHHDAAPEHIQSQAENPLP